MKFFEELKQKFGKVNVSYNELVQVEILKDETEYNSYKFDVVYRDDNDNLLFMGYVSKLKIQDFFSNTQHPLPEYEMFLSVKNNVFLFFPEDLIIVDLRYYLKVSDPIIEMDSFIDMIKRQFPSSKLN
jgi:hypothetical protein